jgi:hypothetical protein
VSVIDPKVVPVTKPVVGLPVIVSAPAEVKSESLTGISGQWVSPPIPREMACGLRSRDMARLNTRLVVSLQPVAQRAPASG